MKTGNNKSRPKPTPTKKPQSTIFGLVNPSTGKNKGKKITIINPVTWVIVKIFSFPNYLNYSPLYTKHIPAIAAVNKGLES